MTEVYEFAPDLEVWKIRLDTSVFFCSHL